MTDTVRSGSSSIDSAIRREVSIAINNFADFLNSVQDIIQGWKRKIKKMDDQHWVHQKITSVLV